MSETYVAMRRGLVPEGEKWSKYAGEVIGFSYTEAGTLALVKNETRIIEIPIEKLAVIDKYSTRDIQDGEYDDPNTPLPGSEPPPVSGKATLEYVGPVDAMKGVEWALNGVSKSGSVTYYEVFPNNTSAEFRATVPADHFEVVSVSREVAESYYG